MRTMMLLIFLAVLFYPIQILAAEAAAVIGGTTEESTVTGQATLSDTAEGLSVKIEVSGVTPGPHGFHIHEIGDCGDAGNAAGTHFNPERVPHGEVLKDGFTGAHAGDLGNIEIGEDGKGSLDLLIPGLTVTGGKYNVEGRAVILHEKQDDFGQPTGNAGGRIGCGVIQLS